MLKGTLGTMLFERSLCEKGSKEFVAKLKRAINF
jgi:hypothetical protein